MTLCFRTTTRAVLGALPLLFLASSANAQLPCFDDEATFVPPGNEVARSIAMDGNLAAVGFATTGSEFVEVYRRVDEVWISETQLTIPSGYTGYFGISVDVDEGTNTVLVGATGIGGMSGSIHAFRQTAGVWGIYASQQAPDSNPSFGGDVAVFGIVACAGSPDSVSQGVVDGVVRVYRLNSSGLTAIQTLTAPVANPPLSGGRFGERIGLSSDGARLIVGVPRRPINGTPLQGLARVYSINGFGLYDEDSGSPLIRTGPGQEMGSSVSVTGNYAVVSAPEFTNTLGSTIGAAYVWRFDSGSSAWTFDAEFYGTTSAILTAVAVEGENFAIVTTGTDRLYNRDAGTGTWAGPITYASSNVDVELTSNSLMAGGDTGSLPRSHRFDCAGVIGTNYCGPALPNSTSYAAEITAIGSYLAGGNPLTLLGVQAPPNESGFAIASQTQAYFNPPGSQGMICVGGNVGRLYSTTQSSGSAGTFRMDIDTLNIPTNPPVAIQPGETWNFQIWFRDYGGTTSNFTDAVQILFQ